MISLEKRLEIRQHPKKTALMKQEWDNLCFIHYKCNKEMIKKRLPEGLFLDTFQEDAYIGVIPFNLNNLAFYNSPPIPGFSKLLELNVRTYVYDKTGSPGVFFFSLGLNSQLGTFVAKNFFYLPYYFDSYLCLKNKNNNYFFSKDRTSEFIFENDNDNFIADPTSLEFFLIERYQLFTVHKNNLYSGRIFHKPYQIANAKILECHHNLFGLNNFQLDDKKPDHVMFSSSLKVDFF